MKKIAVFVIALHLFALILLISKEKKITPMNPKKLSVRTLAYSPPPSTLLEQKATIPVIKKATPMPMVKQQPKKKVSSPSPPPSAGKKKPATKTPSSPIHAKLMKELEESIAKIEGNRDKVDRDKPLTTPRAIEASCEGLLPENYIDKVILCLKESLNLPDFGEVKMKITIRQDGSVESLTVLKTESENNRRYLETHLPLMKFPASKESEHTIVLTFCNEV